MVTNAMISYRVEDIKPERLAGTVYSTSDSLLLGCATHKKMMNCAKCCLPGCRYRYTIITRVAGSRYRIPENTRSRSWIFLSGRESTIESFFTSHSWVGNPNSCLFKWCSFFWIFYL